MYETSEAAVKSELATFFAAFPEGTVWSNEYEGLGYDVVLLGHAQPLQIDPDACQDRLNRPEYADVQASLEEVGFGGAMGLLQTFAGRGRELEPWLADAELNLDRNLRLQYLAGMGLNTYQADEILKSMLAHYRYPEDLFISEGLYGRALKQYLTGVPND